MTLSPHHLLLTNYHVLACDRYYFFLDPTRYFNLLLLEFGIYQGALQARLATGCVVTAYYSPPTT